MTLTYKDDPAERGDTHTKCTSDGNNNEVNLMRVGQTIKTGGKNPGGRK